MNYWHLLLGLCLTSGVLVGCSNYTSHVDYTANPTALAEQKVQTLSLGDDMPSFNLIDATNQDWFSSKEFEGKPAVIIFTSNHCSITQGYEERIQKLANDYAEKSIQVVAISPNSPLAISSEDMEYSDVGDSYDEMVIRARDRDFSFPYLYDGDDHKVSLQFGPKALPHAFLFDKEGKLRYSGLLDNAYQAGRANAERIRSAINSILENRAIIRAETAPFGCEVKWSWLIEEKAIKDTLWQRKPVSLRSINADSLKTLLTNFSHRARLFNFWATWCAPCKKELPEIVEMQRRYRDRPLEVITLCLDKEEKADEALVFLDFIHAAGTNFLVAGENHEKLIERIDPEWDGTLPHTILVEPYGQITTRWQGSIDPLDVRKTIVDHRLMGRFME